ncbi:MAG: hypothetical protein JRI52_09320 [Deltaproteobacteria bacterium]|nr:hypothetical protein [Deltaproteobacteria bacterium]
MADDYLRFKAAAVQAAPVFLDKKGTIDKSCSLIDEASRNGAELIVFPETYIPTYPYWFPEGHALWGEWVYRRSRPLGGMGLLMARFTKKLHRDT